MADVRLVCVGDSFTEGMCDDLRPDGYPIGWSDRVAHALDVINITSSCINDVFVEFCVH